MKKIKDISYYRKLNYSIILKKIDGNYCLFINELSLVAEGKNLDEAYEKLETAKEAIFSQAAHMDVLDDIKEPAPVAFRKKLFVDLAMFFTKTLIVVCICAITLIGSLPFVNVFLIKGLTLMPIRSIYDKVTNMSDQEKEQKKLKLRKLVQNIKPFIDEVRVLSKDEKPQ